MVSALSELSMSTRSTSALAGTASAAQHERRQRRASTAAALLPCCALPSLTAPPAPVVWWHSASAVSGGEGQRGRARTGRVHGRPSAQKRYRLAGQLDGGGGGGGGGAGGGEDGGVCGGGGGAVACLAVAAGTASRARRWARPVGRVGCRSAPAAARGCMSASKVAGERGGEAPPAGPRTNSHRRGEEAPAAQRSTSARARRGVGESSRGHQRAELPQQPLAARREASSGGPAAADAGVAGGEGGGRAGACPNRRGGRCHRCCCCCWQRVPSVSSTQRRHGRRCRCRLHGQPLPI